MSSSSRLEEAIFKEAIVTILRKLVGTSSSFIFCFATFFQSKETKGKDEGTKSSVIAIKFLLFFIKTFFFLIF
jgi:hypothetical protein